MLRPVLGLPKVTTVRLVGMGLRFLKLVLNMITINYEKINYSVFLYLYINNKYSSKMLILFF